MRAGPIPKRADRARALIRWTDRFRPDIRLFRCARPSCLSRKVERARSPRASLSSRSRSTRRLKSQSAEALTRSSRAHRREQAGEAYSLLASKMKEWGGEGKEGRVAPIGRAARAAAPDPARLDHLALLDRDPERARGRTASRQRWRSATLRGRSRRRSAAGGRSAAHRPPRGPAVPTPECRKSRPGRSSTRVQPIGSHRLRVSM